jgi:hypothetical protein
MGVQMEFDVSKDVGSGCSRDERESSGVRPINITENVKRVGKTANKLQKSSPQLLPKNNSCNLAILFYMGKNFVLPIYFEISFLDIFFPV